MKCAFCGGAISLVSGGKGSPRFGCAKSWHNGTSTCTNRLTIRAKVAEPQMLRRLQEELLKSEVQDFIVERVEAELAKQRNGQPQRQAELSKELKDQRKKLQNLVAAIEGGAHAPSLMAALKEREEAVARLEVALARAEQVPRHTPEAASDLRRWIDEQLCSLHALLLSNPERTKTEFRRLHLELVWTPIESEPRPYISVKGQCDLSALACSVLLPAERGLGAVLDRSLEESIHSRTPVLLGFALRLPANGMVGRWRERGTRRR
jgi:hypothetical protein